MNTKDIGDIAEAYVKARCLELGWDVLEPMGDNKPYDIVIDKGEGFKKVQIKHATIREGCVIADVRRVRLSNIDFNGKNGVVKTKYSKEEVDYFALFNIDLKRVFMVPFIERNEVRLRIEDTKRFGNKKSIKWAKDYEI